MLRRQRLHAIEDEEGLEIHRLLGPERAVVVERGDALCGGHEVRRAGLRHLLDEGDDGSLGLAAVPRRQRVGGVGDGGGECHRSEKRGSEEVVAAFGFHGFILADLNSR